MFSFKRAVQRLGITKSQLNQLIESDHFPNAIPPRKNYSQQWQFPIEIIQNYLAALFKKVIELEVSTISIAEAMRVIGNRIEKPLAKLIKAILNEEIRITVIKRQHESNLRSLTISHSDLKQWIRKNINDNKYISIPQLAKLLNINQELTYQLINMGIIDYFIGKDNRKLITEDDLNVFKTRYIFLAKISKALKIGSRTLIEYFASENIFPIDYQWQIKLRQKLYYKAQLKNVALVRSVCFDSENEIYSLFP
ncbi:hypothetical protein MTZ49_03805 [Entomomonas sp. E2T0]|uniref:hypothetical protein n=1 Tax=Entomomonas sp. E2T0 TaxID=2930213 RepID=UPI0022281F9F|nr:hypothetical protein [Entomomonas sp. E2T0]UYZ84698.1 hypothetical protein MTZ49_03805 [Entomomonas sp. E2T0]